MKKEPIPKAMAANDPRPAPNPMAVGDGPVAAAGVADAVEDAVVDMKVAVWAVAVAVRVVPLPTPVVVASVAGKNAEP